MSKFKSVVTTLGQARIASAIESGKDVNITQLAVGDGNGSATEPAVGQTTLVNETYRLKLNSLKIDNKNANWIIAEAIIPAEVGGFWMREMGLFSAEGELIAVSNMADSYKPTLEEGSGRTQTLRMVLTVTDTDAVSLTIDDTLIIATEEYVNNLLAEHEASRRHPDGTLTAKGFVQLSSAVDSNSEILAATPKALKTSYDLAKSANDNANGRLASGGTAVAATKLATARKIAGVAFDGTADINLSAANVGAVPAAGGNVGYLENASRYKIKPGTWEGVGGFATQYTQPFAPFLIPLGYAVPSDVSNYSPFIKGIVQTQKYGYAASVSFGAYTPGDTHFPSAVIHVIGDNGGSSAWFFDSNSGGFSSPGEIHSNGNIVAEGSLYESNGVVRVYSSNNPPTPAAINAIAQDTCSVAGFISGNVQDPYMRNSRTNEVVQLATYGWVANGFVSDIRLGTSTEFQERSNNERMAGGVMTSFKDAGSSNYWIRLRPLQKAVNGNWYTVGYA